MPKHFYHAGVINLPAAWWALASHSSPIFSWYLDTPSSQRTTLSPQLPIQVCAREPPRALIHQWCWSLYDFPRYIWTLPMLFVEQQGVWTALKLAMFEMLSLCINLSWLKIILIISTAKLCSQSPTTSHAPMGFLTACTNQEHFQPEFLISEPTLNCNAKPESERSSHFSPISAEFDFLLFFCPGVLLQWVLFFIAKNDILDKRESWGSLTYLRKSWTLPEGLRRSSLAGR